MSFDFENPVIYSPAIVPPESQFSQSQSEKKETDQSEPAKSDIDQTEADKIENSAKSHLDQSESSNNIPMEILPENEPTKIVKLKSPVRSQKFRKIRHGKCFKSGEAEICTCKSPYMYFVNAKKCVKNYKNKCRKGKIINILDSDGHARVQCECTKGKLRKYDVNRRRCIKEKRFWSDWSECSESCGRGVKVRYATDLPEFCQNDKNSEKCREKEEKKCNLTPCDNFERLKRGKKWKGRKWGKWGRWSPCSVTCGAGKQSRR